MNLTWDEVEVVVCVAIVFVCLVVCLYISVYHDSYGIYVSCDRFRDCDGCMYVCVQCRGDRGGGVLYSGYTSYDLIYSCIGL